MATGKKLRFNQLQTPSSGFAQSIAPTILPPPAAPKPLPTFGKITTPPSFGESEALPAFPGIETPYSGLGQSIAPTVRELDGDPRQASYVGKPPPRDQSLPWSPPIGLPEHPFGRDDISSLEELAERTGVEPGIPDEFATERPDSPGDIAGIAEAELAEWLRGMPSEEDIYVGPGEPYDINPYMEMVGSQQASEAEADPAALAAAHEGLGSLQEMADVGFTEEEFAAREAMAQRQETALRGGELAQFEQMEAMGVGGADLEGVYALNAAQSQAQQAAMQDIETAAATEERKRYGTMAAGQLGAEMAAQSFSQDYLRKQSRDIAASKQAEMMQGYQEKRAHDVERQRIANIELKQRRFEQQGQGVDMLGQAYGVGRISNAQAQARDASSQISIPHQPSAWASTIHEIGQAGSSAFDIYKQSESADASATKDADDAGSFTSYI